MKDLKRQTLKTLCIRMSTNLHKKLKEVAFYNEVSLNHLVIDILSKTNLNELLEKGKKEFERV